MMNDELKKGTTVFQSAFIVYHSVFSSRLTPPQAFLSILSSLCQGEEQTC
jgi:hypothetical protein